MACRIGSLDATDPTESQWKEHLSVAIASGDLQFLQQMWPNLAGSIKDVISEMRRYARSLGWTKQYIEEKFAGDPYQYARNFAPTVWGANVAELSNEPPKSAREAWAEGLLYYSPEYGCELHAAAASVFSDKLAKARLWRAQNGFISPQLDIARSMMCHRLTEKLGKNWPIAYRRPENTSELEEVAKDPLFCQLGHLSFLLGSVKEMQQVQPHFRSLASIASNLRNELSHLRPIDYSSYQSFHKAARLAVS
ncbi:MAG: hypothetical protein ABI614_22785 [Planctomycetota bacterium]